ncbi:MAG: polyunsaturated fatty acid synthase PfaA [Clostridia bacterium]|nr:polyunsaturated fatty acid synthase PfaA [Clostridia bacterium]
MTQTAQVKRILSENIAEVAVVRQGACSHDCAKCGGCGTAVLPTVTAMAENRVGAREGDVVLLETPSDKLLGIAALVYLIPMVFLIAGYLIGQFLGLDSGYCILLGAACFAFSIALIFLLDRYVKRHRTFEFSIVAFQRA